MSNYKELVNNSLNMLNINHRDKLLPAIENNMSKLNDLQNQLKDLEKIGLRDKVANLEWRVVKNKNIVIFKMNLSNDLVRELFDIIKQYKSDVFAFGICVDNDKAVMMAVSSQAWIDAGISANAMIKEMCSVVDGRGGGKNDQAQAGFKRLDLIDQCLSLVETKILE